MLTEAFRIFGLKRVLRNWAVVLRNPACQVLNRKLAVRKWVNAAKRRNRMPFWRLIRVKRRMFADKKQIVSVRNRSIEVRKRIVGAWSRKMEVIFGDRHGLRYLFVR
ncbi:hypothetical protein [Cyclobacterium sp.]|uniref:hypothetical protein n=1 Tax=Cyclobacterium sp. TaxID=1966343 RepID=UPI0019869650|nr:hypothetical protein [Cyclobacterium sp.]MBD3630483.1 hypothetical protein [Cyclobacterium sp.]